MTATSTPERLKWDLKHIGAYDASAIVGLNPFRTQLDVIREKKGLEVPKERNIAMRMGLATEPLNRELYQEATGAEVVNVFPDGVEHPRWPFLGAHPDGIAKLGEGRHPRLVEFKQTAATSKWGDDEDDVDEMARVQTTFYRGFLLARGITVDPISDISVIFVPSYEHRVYHTEVTVEDIDDLFPKLVDFHERCIVGDELPEPKTYAEVVARWPRSSGGVIMANDVLREAVIEDRRLAAEIRKLEQHRKEIRTGICKAMREAATMLDGVKAIAHFKERKGRFDSKTFRAEYPELYEKFRNPSYRELRTYDPPARSE